MGEQNGKRCHGDKSQGRRQSPSTAQKAAAEKQNKRWRWDADDRVGSNRRGQLRGVAFLWGHSTLSMSTFRAFLNEPTGTVFSRENTILHTPTWPGPPTTAPASRDRAFKSHLLCFCSITPCICLSHLLIHILFQNWPLMLSCLFFSQWIRLGLLTEGWIRIYLQ